MPIMSGNESLAPRPAEAYNGGMIGSPMDRDEQMTHEIDNSSRLSSVKQNMITMNRGNGFGGNKNGDLDRQISLLKSCECIKESEVRDLCNMARDILLEESNIQNIQSPITVSILIQTLTNDFVYRFAATFTVNSTT
jgi:hypothetical protein